MSGDTHVEGTTERDETVTLYTEQEARVSYVSIESDALGSIRFNFNHDFPQDAQAFYDALMKVKSITQED